MKKGVRVYRKGFDGDAYEKGKAFGATFPPFSVPIVPDLVERFPKLKEALEEVGAQLVEQYRRKEAVNTYQSIVGLEFVGIDFNLILGKE